MSKQLFRTRISVIISDMYNAIFRYYRQQTRYYLKYYVGTMQNFLFCNCKLQIRDIPKFHPSPYFFSFRSKLNNIYVFVLVFNILKNSMSQYEYLLFDETFLLHWELLGTCSIIKYILLLYTLSLYTGLKEKIKEFVITFPTYLSSYTFSLVIYEISLVLKDTKIEGLDKKRDKRCFALVAQKLKKIVMK